MQRAAFRLHHPAPPHLRRRDRHDLAEHDRLARPDPRRPPDGQRRPVTLAQRPARRGHQVSQPHRHHQRPAARNLPLLRDAADGRRHDRVDMHERLLW